MNTIKKDKLIVKFSLYGFLKNLKFFEPFLVIYLLDSGLSLFQIGILYSIREIVTYLLEVPSGIFADHYGKKTELSICFILYIVSFVFFYVGGVFGVFVIAMLFFGAGEAFRSGTHKAIIMEYLEEKNWFEHKSMVYGRTRSFSLIGSSISSFVSILFLLQFDNMRLLFLICIVPYILDFILILSYPRRFNTRSQYSSSAGRMLMQGISDLKTILRNRHLMKVTISSSLFDAVVKGIKDYIQPVLQTIILASSFVLVRGFDSNDTLTIYLAVIYGLLYIISSIATRNVWRLNELRKPAFLMNISMDILGVFLILMAAFIWLDSLYLIVIVYFTVIVLKDARRPIVVDVFGELMDKNHRATVLSVDSQFRALFLIVLAPTAGFVADTFSIPIMLVGIGFICVLANRLIGKE